MPHGMDYHTHGLVPLLKEDMSFQRVGGGGSWLLEMDSRQNLAHFPTRGQY